MLNQGIYINRTDKSMDAANILVEKIIKQKYYSNNQSEVSYVIKSFLSEKNKATIIEMYDLSM
jgi:hypothetical protein